MLIMFHKLVDIDLLIDLLTVWSYFGLIFQKITILTTVFDRKCGIKGPKVQEILQTMLQTMLQTNVKTQKGMCGYNY